MPANIEKNGNHYYVNDKGDEICIAVHDKEWNLVECFKFHSGHPAIKQGWSDEKIVDYCEAKLVEQGRLTLTAA
jgi:hypothetical protein